MCWEVPSTIRTVFIVTDEPEAVARAVLNGLGIGVTTWPAQGEFTGAAHAVLFCTVGRPDVNALRSIVTEADRGAFVVVGQGHQASGGVLRAQPWPAPTVPQEQERMMPSHLSRRGFLYAAGALSTGARRPLVFGQRRA